MAGHPGEVTAATGPAALGSWETARLFTRLKLSLVAGNLRGDATRKAGFAITVALAVLAGLTGFALFALLRLAGPGLATDLGVLAFTFLALAWILIPLLAFGLDETLDPARLALFPLTTRRLAIGMFAASVAGPWPLASLFALAGAGVGLSRSLTGALLAVPAVLLQFALCVVASRAVTTGLSGALRTRRGKDLLAVAAVFLILLSQLPGLILNRGLPGDPLELLKRAAEAARWTPPGMAAHAVGDGGLIGLAELAAVAAAVVLLGWAWIALLRRALVTPDAAGSAAAVRRSRFRPDGVFGAIVAKELKYARREPRGRIGWLSVLMVSAVLTFSFTGPDRLAGGWSLVLLAAGTAAVMTGLQAANGFGIDGGSLWMNAVVFAAPADLRRDLAARQFALALVAVPILTVIAVAAAVVAGDPFLALPGALVAWGILGAALGAGAVTTVVMPYTFPDRLNAFTGAAPGQGGVAFVSSFGAMLGGGLAALPVILPAAFGLTWIGVLAVPYGLAVAWAGRRLAATIGFARYPDILAAVSKPS